MNGDNEAKKRFLKRYIEAKKATTEIREELEELEGRYIMPSKVIDDMPHGSGQSDLSEFAAQYDALWRQGKDLLEAEMRIRMEIVNAINDMPTGEALKTLMRYRYIQGKTWEQIAVRMGYTYQWVCVLHGKALEAFIIPKS